MKVVDVSMGVSVFGIPGVENHIPAYYAGYILAHEYRVLKSCNTLPEPLVNVREDII